MISFMAWLGRPRNSPWGAPPGPAPTYVPAPLFRWNNNPPAFRCRRRKGTRRTGAWSRLPFEVKYRSFNKLRNTKVYAQTIQAAAILVGFVTMRTAGEIITEGD